MKRENWIYLLSFLFGIVMINLLASTTWINSSNLNRYSLASLSFRGIVYEEYFFHVFFLRMRTAFVLWVLTKLLPKKMVSAGFGVLSCCMLGGVLAFMILVNGLWGILFCICAFFPHAICYGAAYMLWRNSTEKYLIENLRREKYFVAALILVLIGIGCVCETYITPILLENIIKY